MAAPSVPTQLRTTETCELHIGNADAYAVSCDLAVWLALGPYLSVFDACHSLRFVYVEAKQWERVSSIYCVPRVLSDNPADSYAIIFAAHPQTSASAPAAAADSLSVLARERMYAEVPSLGIQQQPLRTMYLYKLTMEGFSGKLTLVQMAAGVVPLSCDAYTELLRDVRAPPEYSFNVLTRAMTPVSEIPHGLRASVHADHVYGVKTCSWGPVSVGMFNNTAQLFPVCVTPSTLYVWKSENVGGGVGNVCDLLSFSRDDARAISLGNTLHMPGKFAVASIGTFGTCGCQLYDESNSALWVSAAPQNPWMHFERQIMGRYPSRSVQMVRVKAKSTMIVWLAYDLTTKGVYLCRECVADDLFLQQIVAAAPRTAAADASSSASEAPPPPRPSRRPLPPAPPPTPHPQSSSSHR